MGGIKAQAFLATLLAAGAVGGCAATATEGGNLRVWVGGDGGWATRGYFREKYESGKLTGVGNLNGVWVRGDQDVVFATSGGYIVHLDGDWEASNLSTLELDGHWTAIADGEDTWVVGKDGKIAQILDLANGNVMEWEVPTGKNLHSVCSWTNDLTYVAGDDGTFFKFNGSGWTKIQIPDAHVSAQDLNGSTLSFSGVWVVGDTGTILQAPADGSPVLTRHSGTWPNKLTDEDLHAVYSNLDQVWAVGAQGTILYSDDEGESWTLQTSSTKENLHGIAGVGSQIVVVGDGGTKLATWDGGMTWVDEDFEENEDGGMTKGPDRNAVGVLAVD